MRDFLRKFHQKKGAYRATYLWKVLKGVFGDISGGKKVMPNHVTPLVSFGGL